MVLTIRKSRFPDRMILMNSLFSKLQTTWLTFSSAPHRMFFFTGMWQLVAVSAWWAIVLAGRAAGWGGLEPVLPAMFMHGGLVLFLMFTPFMAGFLFTVFPRWQPAPEIPRSIHLLVFASLNLGQLGFLVGMYVAPTMVALAVAVLAVGWTALIGGLSLSLLRARQRVPHAGTVLVGLLGGYAGLLLFLYAASAGDWSDWPLVRALGIWAFLLPIYFSVSHRMVPFFTSRVVPGYVVYRSDILLYAVIVLSVVRALLELLPDWRWLASVPLALVLIALNWKWWPRRGHENALMSVLHLSLLWLSAGVLLYAVQDVAMWQGVHLLGRAPLHALGIGFFGGMLVSMVTRVSLGHSGRPLALDRFTWLVYWLVQLSVTVRILGEFMPAAYSWLMAIAALLWLAAFVAWARRFIGIFVRPRVDGAPG